MGDDVDLALLEGRRVSSSVFTRCEPMVNSVPTFFLRSAIDFTPLAFWAMTTSPPAPLPPMTFTGAPLDAAT